LIYDRIELGRIQEYHPVIHPSRKTIRHNEQFSVFSGSLNFQQQKISPPNGCLFSHFGLLNEEKEGVGGLTHPTPTITEAE
jgi:hypothetical protein